jgi:alpha-beta hydrolase superfamily lysophospholipase
VTFFFSSWSAENLALLRCTLLLTVALIQGCSTLFFVPERQLILTPEKAGLSFEVLPVDTPDGIRLHGWLLHGKPPVRGTIVFLHGNAQNISYHLASVFWLPAAHYNVYLYDYRGFGKSEGKATIANAIADFPAVLKTLQTRLPDDDHGFIIFGQSLGAAIAIAAVAEHKDNFPIDALIADSAFSGLRRIAREKLALIPLTRPFARPLALTFPKAPDLLQSIGEVAPIPVLLIHGTEDQIVPPDHSQQLYDAAGEPRQLWLIPDARHIQALTSKPIRQRLLDYLKTVTTAAKPPAP